MGFKNDVREMADEFKDEMADLTNRVVALESLARQLQNGQVSVTRTARPAPHTPAGERMDRAATSSPTGVDYGAIAFGLASIKSDVSGIRGANVSREDLNAHYAKVVDYFADVFAKADPAFDRAEFNLLAGA